MDELGAQCQKLRQEGATAQEEYTQVIQQTEADFDDNTQRIKVRMESVQDASRQKIEELNAQIHSYTRYA